MDNYVESDKEAACILNRAAEAGVFDDLIQDRRDNPSAWVLIHDRVIELIGRASRVDWEVPHWEPYKVRIVYNMPDDEMPTAAEIGTAIHEDLADSLAGRRQKKIVFTVGGHSG